MVTTKDEAREALRTVINDMEAQMDYLEGLRDKPWDTEDFDNWEAMIDQLIKVAKFAKLNIL